MKQCRRSRRFVLPIQYDPQFAPFGILSELRVQVLRTSIVPISTVLSILLVRVLYKIHHERASYNWWGLGDTVQSVDSTTITCGARDCKINLPVGQNVTLFAGRHHDRQKRCPRERSVGTVCNVRTVLSPGRPLSIVQRF